MLIPPVVEVVEVQLHPVIVGIDVGHVTVAVLLNDSAIICIAHHP